MASSDTPIVHFEHLEFVDGSTLDLPASGVTVIVGPNNVGKSTALGELGGFIRTGVFEHNSRACRVLASGSLALAPEDEFCEWFRRFEDEVLPEPVHNPNLRRLRNWSTSINLDPAHLFDRFRNVHDRQSLTPFLTSWGAHAVFDGQTPDLYGMGQTMAADNRQFQQLYFNPANEARISDFSVKVFGVPVRLSRYGRTSVLHWGEIPTLPLNPSPEEIQELRSVPRVAEQGEGVRALMTLAITLELGDEPIVVLDEPDAHLHPPQARIAGEFVAQRAARSQVFIATHSVDFLLGVLSSTQPTTIVRLDRQNECTKVSVLSADALRTAWSDATVKYSGILAGLMHRGVVLCEADGDCRYYEAALDHLTADQPAHDFRFVPSGGKQGLRKLASVLRAIAVPTSIVADFDVLREWSSVADLYEVLGGDRTSIQPMWELVNQQLSTKLEPRTVGDLIHDLSGIVDQFPADQRHDPKVADAVRHIARVADGWAKAKEHGLDALRGSPRQAGEDLLTRLAAVGLHVVRWGELESFHRSVSPRPKSAWVTRVLDAGLHRTLSSEQASWLANVIQPPTNR